MDRSLTRPDPSHRRASSRLARALLCLGVGLGLGLAACGSPPGGRREGAADSASGDGSGLDDVPVGTTRDAPGPIGDARPGFDGNDVVRVSDAAVLVPLPDGGTFVCYPVSCAGRFTECGDCEDNDGDGLVDSQDPECLGPCDNSEGPGLAGGIGGQNRSNCKVDCYFDFGNGAGNDNCLWDHRCDPLEPEAPDCTYDQSLVGGRRCPDVQDPSCADSCLAYTPNGCDCFGCCTFPELEGSGPNGGPGYVFIGKLDDSNNSTCTFADITDTEACPPCTPVANCQNGCGRCEVCIGRPVPPDDCFMSTPPDGGVPDGGVPDGGPVNPEQCAPTVQPCGLPGQAACPPLHYCITGCCVRVQG